MLEPPSAPINVVIVKLGSRKVVLSWQDGTSATPGNPPADTYQVLLNNSPTINVTNTSVTLEGLLPFTSYNVTIVAENRIGISDSSEPVSFMTAEEGMTISFNILTTCLATHTVPYHNGFIASYRLGFLIFNQVLE